MIREGWSAHTAGAVFITAGSTAGFVVCLWFVGEMGKHKFDPDIANAAFLGSVLLAFLCVVVGTLLRKRAAQRSTGRPRGTAASAVHYTAALTLGVLGGASFLWPDTNTGPMWLVTGPPLLLANFLLMGIQWAPLILAFYVGYYFAILLPGFRAVKKRGAEGAYPSPLIATQAGLLLVHVGLTAVLAGLMRA